MNDFKIQRLVRCFVIIFINSILIREGIAQTVWNINVGSDSNQIAKTDNYIGAATENTTKSTWNHISSTTTTILANSGGNNSAGVTFKISPIATSSINFGGQTNTSGDKIFTTWIKEEGNDDLFEITFGNLNPASTYSLVVYSDWYWTNGDGAMPVTQTAGTGLKGTFQINRDVSSGENGKVGPLLADTNSSDVASGKMNYARFDGLRPGSEKTLSFSMGGVNGPVNGFQFIEARGGARDASAPSPNPMTWASVPAATGSDSITMIATTASDSSDVEYYFDETSGNPGGTDSGWQSSPSYTDTGLSPRTNYIYTVMARDKSPALNKTKMSARVSATTTSVPTYTVWNVQFANEEGNQIATNENFMGAASQNTANSTWNRVASVPQTNMVLKKSTGQDSGVTMDLTGGDVKTQNLTSGLKIFNSRIGGGSTSNLTLKGLSITNSYDFIFYSDWWWKDGDALPITQMKGKGLEGTVFINRNSNLGYGTVTALEEDVDAANNAAITGNWMRVNGITPAVNGEISFRLTDGNNTPFNGFQMVASPLAPRADILAFRLSTNPTSLQEAEIDQTTIVMTVPYGTSITNLAPTFVLWPDAKCSIPSGTVRDFSKPQTYTVTSSDSRVTKKYIVSVKIAPPLPEFTLTAPATWDGRSAITVQPNISNLAVLQANYGANFTYQWGTSNLATTQTVSPGVMTLTRSQGNGILTVTLTMTNGTLPVTRSTTIDVQQPASDPWVERTPLPNEKPVNGQFFARNPQNNLGTMYYRGTESGSPDDVFLKVYRTPSGGAETLHATHRQPLLAGSYDFTATMQAGLFTYRVVYGTRENGVDKDVSTVNDLLCGDAFIIEGQSNAQATDNSEPQENTIVPWVKTYQLSSGWGPAYAKPLSPQWDGKIGFWGMKLAQEIVSKHNMPICIINGAVGGTRIDQHQPNPVDRTIGGGTYDIYANLLNRVTGARLTHGIRAAFWHQGESDCANFGPSLDPDYQHYEQHFLTMTSAWKQDFPNLNNYFIFQVAVNPCSIGPFASELREVQRNLPRLYSNMLITNAHGLEGYDGCHYTKSGYENIAARLFPMVDSKLYGTKPAGSVTPPNLVKASFPSGNPTAIALEFDQQMTWSSLSLPNYYINSNPGLVTSGSVSGNTVTLQLSSAAPSGSTISYGKDTWDYKEPVSTLLHGANGIPAFTFANVSIQAGP